MIPLRNKQLSSSSSFYDGGQRVLDSAIGYCEIEIWLGGGHRQSGARWEGANALRCSLVGFGFDFFTINEQLNGALDDVSHPIHNQQTDV
jgi:hypothetical protein